MSQSLPTHGLRFLKQEGISALKLQDLPNDGENGYIFEVDLHYPTSLQNTTNTMTMHLLLNH